MEAQAMYGLILNLEEDGVRASILGDTARVEGMTVNRRAVFSCACERRDARARGHALGEPADGKGPFKKRH